MLTKVKQVSKNKKDACNKSRHSRLFRQKNNKHLVVVVVVVCRLINRVAAVGQVLIGSDYSFVRYTSLRRRQRNSVQ